eukprot:TRINITY_DN10650_c0_g1_i2.p1 TRINITY_DN10650_c0_g1~~TRINITY_DN10650_c0_g1_i2.p1  ORF type:complete len:752 (-),score=126.27 TRINITY_DN10650_c0_g1_i2:417-2672(-)
MQQHQPQHPGGARVQGVMWQGQARPINVAQAVPAAGKSAPDVAKRGGGMRLPLAGSAQTTDLTVTRTEQLTPKGDRPQQQPAPMADRARDNVRDRAQLLPATKVELTKEATALNQGPADVDSLSLSQTTMASTVTHAPVSIRPRMISTGGCSGHEIGVKHGLVGTNVVTNPSARSGYDLAVDVQEGLARLSTRVDSAIGDLNMRLDASIGDLKAHFDDLLGSRIDSAIGDLHMRLEGSMGDLNKEVQHLVEQARADTAEARTSCFRKVETVEQHLTVMREEATTAMARTRSLEQGLTEVKAACNAHVEALERSQAAEAEARAELERTIAEDLRDQVVQESSEVRETVMREMRERMEGQKVLRDEMQHQQQTIMQLMSRMDEASVELRTAVPRLAQDLASQKAEACKWIENLACTSERVEVLEKAFVEESSARRSSEKALAEALRDELAADSAKSTSQVMEFRLEFRRNVEAAQEQARERSETCTAQIESVKDRLAKGERGSAAADSRIVRLTKQLQDVQATFERRVKEFEATFEQRVKEFEDNNASKVAKLETQVVESKANLERGIAELEEDNSQHVASIERKVAESEADVRSCLDSKVVESETVIRGFIENTVMSRVASLDAALQDVDSGMRSWVDAKVTKQSDSLESALRTSEANLKGWVDSTLVPRIDSLDKAFRSQTFKAGPVNSQAAPVTMGRMHMAQSAPAPMPMGLAQPMLQSQQVCSSQVSHGPSGPQPMLQQTIQPRPAFFR